jgi:hypothetical protein
MALSKIELVRELAQLVGIAIAAEEEAEVADRFESLMQELECLAQLDAPEPVQPWKGLKLTQLDLAAIQPVTIFPEEA